MVGQNRPLHELPESHVARRTVIAHTNCHRHCVAKEIPWPGSGKEPFDQKWHSKLLGREFAFSSFAYAFISFDLVMTEWNTHPPHVTDAEVNDLVRIPLLRTLLTECEAAAEQTKNVHVQKCVRQIHEFLDLWDESIRLRIQQDGLEVPRVQEPDNPRQELFPGSPWLW
ncbi:MAG: hypothetical protein KDA44_01460 [Planctomycetales bacterium]|nr:hypothetical protein [Planctomycetales bacterium]